MRTYNFANTASYSWTAKTRPYNFAPTHGRFLFADNTKKYRPRVGKAGTALAALVMAAGCSNPPTAPTNPPPASGPPPTRMNGSPTGALPSGTRTQTLEWATDVDANCKYATAKDTPYGSMPNTPSTTGSKAHRQTLNDLVDGKDYLFFVKCESMATKAQNTDDYPINFSVISSECIAFGNNSCFSLMIFLTFL